MITTENPKGHIISGISELFPKMHLSPKYHIGIDPDVNFNGVAVYDKKLKKLLVCTSLKYFDVKRILESYRDFYIRHDLSFLVHIEGGWLVAKSNFHDETLKTNRK